MRSGIGVTWVLRAAVAACVAGLAAAGGYAQAQATGQGPRANAVIDATMTIDPATVHCLGFQVLVTGDANANARIDISYAKASRDAEGEASAAEPMRRGLPLLRVTSEALVRPPAEGTTLFAGSILDLEPETEYAVELRLSDPDGGSKTWRTTAATRGEPAAPAPARVLHVTPGSGGGSGSEVDPYRGLDAAQAAARPGDLILVGGGSYPATWTVTKSGEPGMPIIWRGKAGEEAVIEGEAGAAQRPARGISATDIADVWFEGLVVRNADWAVVAHRSRRIVMRHCLLTDVEYGFTCTGGPNYAEDFFITDNVMEGPSTWPREKGIESARGVQVSGTGHVVAYNRIRGFSDGVDTFGTFRTRATEVCGSIDIYGNEISEMTDDGIEVDYSQQNVRCFDNRLTNVFQGISQQPVNGGPVYIYRNAMYNIEVEPFKMHLAGEKITSGFYFFHNTSVKQGIPWMVWSQGARVNNVVSRNNLFIGTPTPAEGTQTPYAFDFTTQMELCDFDYDGFGGGPFRNFGRWLGVVYPTIEAVRARSPVERNAVIVDAETVFASGLQAPSDYKRQYGIEVNDLRLKPGSAAIDAGVAIPGVNDGFFGKAPDLGAYETGRPLPHYGPRPRR